MFCRNCGAKLPEDSSFCVSCGGRIQPEKKPNRDRHHKTNKGLKVTIAILSGILIISLTVVGILAFSNHDLRIFQKHIENRAYRSARDQYEILSPKEQTEADQWMREYVSQIEEQYYSGEVDYVAASSLLEDLLQFECSFSEATAVSENIYWDNLSATAFQEAKDLTAENKWREAYESLEEVRTDYRDYADAVQLREDCIANFRDKILNEVSDLMQNGDVSLLNEEAIETLYGSLEFLSQKDSTFMDAFEELLFDVVRKAADDAIALAEKGEHSRAAELLAEQMHRNEIIFAIAAELSGDSDEFSEFILGALDDYFRKEIAVAQNMAETGNYEGALEILNLIVRELYTQDVYDAWTSISVEALIAQGKVDEAVQTIYYIPVANPLRSELHAQYVIPWISETLLKAQELAQSGKYQEAIDYLTEKQALFPWDDIPEFQASIMEYTNYLPQ